MNHERASFGDWDGRDTGWVSSRRPWSIWRVLTRKELEANRIDFDGVKTLGTPRRLVLVIRLRFGETEGCGDEKDRAFKTGCL